MVYHKPLLLELLAPDWLRLAISARGIECQEGAFLGGDESGWAWNYAMNVKVYDLI